MENIPISNSSEQDGVLSPHPRNLATLLRAAEDLLHDHWTLQVLAELTRGPCRYQELASNLDGISADVLAARLASFEANGVVACVRLDEAPSDVVYQLTEKGRRGEQVVTAAAAWARTLFPGIDNCD